MGLLKRLSLTDLVPGAQPARATARALRVGARPICRVTLNAARRWFSAGRGSGSCCRKPRNAPYKVLKAAWTDDDVMGKWEATSPEEEAAAKKKREHG